MKDSTIVTFIAIVLVFLGGVIGAIFGYVDSKKNVAKKE